jgi:Holliday junction resolvase RusA-like endonuclease
MATDKRLRYTEKQLDEMLQKNPLIKINERYSQLSNKSKNPKKPKRPKIQPPPLRYYDIERPIKLFIPFVPPSLNRVLAMNQWERRKLKEEFVNDIRWMLMYNKVRCFRSPVVLLVTLFYSVERRRDKDNYLKWLLDSLRGVLIVDDSPEYLEDVQVKFEKGKKHMEIKVIPIAKDVSA